jgi:hypothetical protein
MAAARKKVGANPPHPNRTIELAPPFMGGVSSLDLDARLITGPPVVSLGDSRRGLVGRSA